MKKLLPLLTLIIGFITGYYVCTVKTKYEPAAAARQFPSENSISQEEAQLLVYTFGNHWMEDANNKVGGKGEKTRSVYIPLTKLDSLCAAMDAQRKIDGITDGIRVYFGRYPEFQPDGKTPYEHAYHNTIILVSTKTTRILPRGQKDSISIHLDYYGSGNKKIALHMFALDPQNRGDLCPNICDGATLVCADPTDPTCTGN